ncbi:MAG TPA: response regulator [Spirochaetota bacterium]|nr:response regulator [Spirochaetota bacterium]
MDSPVAMKKKILIIENEAFVSWELEELLNEKGYNVCDVIAQGDRVMDGVREHLPDLILMDIYLEGDIDGITLSENINRDYTIPVIYITGFKDEEILKRISHIRHYGFILKPFNREAVLATVQLAIHQHSLELKTMENERKYRMLFESMLNGYGLFTINEDINTAGGKMSVSEVNTAYLKMLGIGEDDDILRATAELFANGHDFEVYMNTVQSMGKAVTFEQYLARLARWFSVTCFQPLPGTCAILLVDITEQREARYKIEQYNRELLDLTAHIEVDREKDRVRIARDLHDNLGHLLTALKFDASYIKNKVNPDESNVLDKINGMSSIIDEGIMTVRGICSELRPGILDDIGLAAAMKWFASETSKRAALRIDVALLDEDICDELTDDLRVALFRIFQESLTNVIRHASASAVHVELNCVNNMLILEISDNGRGISPEQTEGAKSFGIIGMRERVRFFNGEFIVKGANGKGTSVIVKIPLQ